MVTYETRLSPAQKMFNLAVKNLQQDLKDIPLIPTNLTRTNRSALERLADLKTFNHPDTQTIINHTIGQLSETTPFTRQLINHTIIEVIGKRNMLDSQYVIAKLEDAYNTNPINQSFTSQEKVIDMVSSSQPKFSYPKISQPFETLSQNEFFIHLGAQMLLIEYPQLAYLLIKKLKESGKINSKTPDNFDFNDLLSVQDKDTVATNFIKFLKHNQLTINSGNLQDLIA